MKPISSPLAKQMQKKKKKTIKQNATTLIKTKKYQEKNHNVF